MYLIFDTETTGLPRNFKAPITDTDNWPRCIQIAWQLHDALGNLIEHRDFLLQPEGFNIPFDAERIHGISTELAQDQGIPLEKGLALFNEVLSDAELLSQEEYLRWRYGFVFDPDAIDLSFAKVIHDERTSEFRLEDDSIVEAG